MSIAALIKVHTEQGAVYLNPSRILSVEEYRNGAHPDCFSAIQMNIPNLVYRVKETRERVVELVAGIVAEREHHDHK